MNAIHDTLQAEGVGGLAGLAVRFVETQAALVYQSIVIPFAVNQVSKRLEKSAEGIKTVKALVDFAFNFSCLGVSVKPVQNTREITDLCNLLRERGVKNIMEIGTDSGGTLFLFSRIASSYARIVSVNLPYGTLNAWCMKYRNVLYESFATRSQRISLLTANSHENSTLRKVTGALGGEKLDFLFIDGDHSYEGVKQDFEMYSPLVKKGGIVGFHDITGVRNTTVGRYWRELKKGYRHKEIEYTKGPGLGIGIIYL